MEKKVLFITKQNELVQKIEKENLQGIWIDTAKSKASAMHYLRNKPCQYTLVVIDEKLPDASSSEMLVWVHTQHPELPVIGISYSLSAWQQTPGPFRHIGKYNNNDHTPTWQKEELLTAFETFGLNVTH